MTVLVDPVTTYPPARTRHLPGRSWSHMVSDTSFEELHAMAESLGVTRGWFHRDHYDIPPDVRERAIEAGAQPVTRLELAARRLKASRRGAADGEARAEFANPLRGGLGRR